MWWELLARPRELSLAVETNGGPSAKDTGARLPSSRDPFVGSLESTAFGECKRIKRMRGGMLIPIRAVVLYHDSRSSLHWRPLAYSSSSYSWVWSRALCQRWSGTTPLRQTSRVSWNLKISPADGGDLVVLSTLNVARAKAAQERRPRAGRRKAVALGDSR